MELEEVAELNGDTSEEDTEEHRAAFDRDTERVLTDVANHRAVSERDLEELVRAGHAGEVLTLLEVNMDSEEGMTRNQKIVAMSNLHTLSLNELDEEVGERLRTTANRLTSTFKDEDWSSPLSVAEADFLRCIVQVSSIYPGWAGAILEGLLRRAEQGEDALEEKERELRAANAKLESVVKSIVVNPPDTSRMTTSESLELNCDIIRKQVKVQSVTRDLEEAVNQLKLVSVVPEVDGYKAEEGLLAALKDCRDVDQINRNIDVLHCQVGIIRCKVCRSAMFTYGREDQTRAEGEKLAKSFYNLRDGLRKHLCGDQHKKNFSEAKEHQVEEKQWQSRNALIGNCLFKVIYLIASHRLPFTVFPELVRLLAELKVDVGELNHSEKFCSKTLPVMQEVKKSLN